jgi:hypothetical protein
MTDAPGQNKKMPDAVKMADPFIQSIKHNPDGIEDAADEKTCKTR